MSRKRTVKKQQKRQESTLAQLEELYLRGADDEFLARAAEQLRDPAASPLAAEWAEVADRALRQSLARADLGHLERLLTRVRRGGPLCPAAALAEAALDIAAGRLDAARSRLAILDAVPGISPELLTALRSLARDLPDSRWPDLPGLRAAEGFFRDLQSLEARDFAVTRADREALARSLDAVRAAAPGESGDLGRLLDSAGRCLSLITDLVLLEEKLDRLPESDPSSASPLVLDWLQGHGPLLAATLTASELPLLAPLRHSVRLRWRAVLERVAAREGSAGLTALCTAEPRLLAGDVFLPGGIPAALVRLRQEGQARQLLNGGQYEELAGLLRSCSQSETDSGALAALWSLELWALCLRNEEDADKVNWLAELLEPPARRALARLQAMAGEIGRRFPAEQRAGVARWLRDELFNLCEQADLGEPTARAARALLEHHPGDAGLLIVGIAGAVAGNDSQTLRALKDQVSRSRAEVATAQRMMIQVAREDPPTVAKSLDLLRPLFADRAWPEIVTLVAREIGERFTLILSTALFESAMGGRRGGERAFASIRRQLDRLGPALAGTPAFAGMELAFDYCQPGPIAEKRIPKFLADHPGLEGALTAFRLLEGVSMTPRLSQRIKRARNVLAQAVIERLDERWELWEPALQGLLIHAGAAHLPRLEEKLRQLLASPELSRTSRQHLEQALQRAQRILRPQPPRKARKKTKTRSPRSGTPQLRLEIG